MAVIGPLLSYVADAEPVPHGLPLVIALTGFTDAGGAVSQVVDVLRDDIETAPVAVFANDVLLDYRARRPIIRFEHDHLTDYRPPRLELALAQDAAGRKFLALTGYEPDFAWDAFAQTVVELAHGHQISQVTWVHAIAMPVPHTRPIGATVSGNRADLIEAHSVWRPQTEVPATAGHLLELRLTEAGFDMAGFVLLVPHYLSDSEYPAAALTAIESLSLASGVVLPTEALREGNREFLQKVDEQIAESDELAQLVHNLEENYDRYMADAPGRSAVLGEYDIPSADELAAELERYLATRPGTDEDKRG